MADGSWHADPTGRHQHRFWNGSEWTENTADNGVTSKDPIGDDEAEALQAPAEEAETTGRESAVPDPASNDSDKETGEVPDAQTDADTESAPAAAAVVPPAPTSNKSRREWTFRRWHVIVAAVAIALVAAAIGAATQQSKINDLNSNNDALTTQNSRVTEQRDTAQAKVNDRSEQAAADKAKADRIAAEEKQSADKAAADKAAADKAAAQQAAAAAAAAAKKDTATGDGVFAAGTDINPGTWHTDGGGECYYAILNSSDTSDIADNNNITGPATLVLNPGQFLDLSGPCVWHRTA